MEESKLESLTRVVKEFSKIRLCTFEYIEIEAIYPCTKPDLIQCDETILNRKEQLFRAVLTLRHHPETVRKYNDSKIQSYFEGPKGLTLILDDKEVVEMLWHGIDIAGENSIGGN